MEEKKDRTKKLRGKFEDEKRKQVQRKETLGGGGIAAAALGASAAVLYGKRNITRVFKTLERANAFFRNSSVVRRNLSGDVRASSLKSIWSEGKKEWLKEKYSGLILRGHDNKTLQGLISQFNSLRFNRAAHHDAFNRQLRLNAMNFYERTFSKGDINEDRHFIRFISDIAGNIHGEGSVEKALGRQNFNPQQLSRAVRIAEYIKENDTKEARNEFLTKLVKRLEAARKDTIENVAWLERNFGSRRSQTWKDRITGHRAATIKELLANRHRFLHSIAGTNEKGEAGIHDVIDELRLLGDKIAASQDKEMFERFLEITPDRSVRIDPKGEIYSTGFIKDMKNDFLDMVSGTVPGKILKLRSAQQERGILPVQLIPAGSYDPLLAAKLNPSGENSESFRGFTGKTVLRVGEDFYSQDEETGTNKLDINLLPISGKWGHYRHVLRSMLGDTAFKENSNSLLSLLDIGQNYSEYRGNILAGIKDRLKNTFRNSDEAGPQRRLLNPGQEEIAEFSRARREKDLFFAEKYLDEAKQLQKLWKENTYELSAETAEILSRSASGKAKSIFEDLYSLNDGELLAKMIQTDAVVEETGGFFLNHDLNALMIAYRNNPVGTLNRVYLKTDRNRISGEGGSLLFRNTVLDPKYGKESADFYKQLRTELAKEAFLRQAAESDNEIMGLNYADRNYGRIDNLLRSLTDVSEKDRLETERLARLAVFQDATGINYEHTRTRDTEEIWHVVENIETVLNADPKNTTRPYLNVRETLKEIQSEQHSVFDAVDADGNIAAAPEYEEIIHIPKGIGILDVLRNLNDREKLYASAKSFGRQIVAGNESREEITQYTTPLYFFGQRLSEAMNTLGLGFSRNSSGSIAALTKNIMLKRVIPFAVVSTYLEWADDTFKELTGTSISGAAANGLANIDLAGRRLLDITGATDWLKAEKRVNPILQYWGEKNDFQSYEERKKYYESGYDPVRRGAWWTFGGVQEARGGAIEYFTPSFARRINSDYFDKSLYDGYSDKWSHSFLPTPSNPLSPIMAITDPYWLEERHKDDRPYPLSGQLFQEGTPWGAVLNPTIGAVIKPQREYRGTIFGMNRINNGVDIRAAITALNRKITEHFQDEDSGYYSENSNGSANPVKYIAYDSPTDGTDILSVSYNPEANGFYFPNKSESRAYENKTEKVLPLELIKRPDIESLYLSGPEERMEGQAKFLRQGDIVYSQKGRLGIMIEEKPLTLRDVRETGRINLTDSLSLDTEINHRRSRDFQDLNVVAMLVSRKEFNNMVSGIIAPLSDVAKDFRAAGIIGERNRSIKEIARAGNDRGGNSDVDGFVLPDRIRDYRPSDGMEFLEDPDQVAELLVKGKGADFVREASSSFRLIGGMYGYLAQEVSGFGQYQEPVLATAQEMTGYSRGFWDMGFGGAGGDVMEIVRRFIPEIKRGNLINPIMNNMPDWLPEKYRFGDGYSMITKGEMRLPGKGYESMNELHPDIYGAYGAFDRFKILADIAPFSLEYKTWKEIASRTTTDPELLSEMKEISRRAREQTKRHDFYDYKLMGKDISYKNLTVTEALDHGRFRSGSEIYKLAGVTIDAENEETGRDILQRYLKPGMEITVAVDSNEDFRENRDNIGTINAEVFIDGEALSEKLEEEGFGRKREGDNSAPAMIAGLGPFQRLLGQGAEIISHADVPWLSDQFLRVRTPLESYRAEVVYGTMYQSWEHPLNTFLIPAIERAVHQEMPVKTFARMLFERNYGKRGQSRLHRHLYTMAYAFSDRGAFIGGAVAGLFTMGSGTMAKKAMAIGSNLAALGHFMTGGNGFMDMMTTGALLGMRAADFFAGKTVKGAALGAAVGTLYRSMVREKGEWIPDRVRRNWTVDDYFDRITYMKYMGLYHAAAEKALEEEDVDVETLSEQQETLNEEVHENLARLRDIKKRLQRATKIQGSYDEKDRLLDIINDKIRKFSGLSRMSTNGKWTQSALIYKKAAESTVYGLKKGAGWTEIVTALPVNDREYFLEFVKEKDREKREEILETVSPSLRKALKMAWGMNFEKPFSNERFFRNKPLPDADWDGWLPENDLRDTELKVIANEGMNLSDFGFYESQLRDEKVIFAPNIDTGEVNTADTGRIIQQVLQGHGLRNVNVCVMENQEIDEMKIISDIELWLSPRKVHRMASENMRVE